jgi:3-hydroxyacyl-[acyl-carrier-protein] dehydratase
MLMIYKTLYEIKDKEQNSAVIELCDKNHPVFKAHFPMKPVLPGFIHFEIVSDIFDLEITTIKKAKFMKMVLPKETLTYEKDNNKFKVLCKGEEVANFSL